jgi:hypothetical protein
MLPHSHKKNQQSFYAMKISLLATFLVLFVSCCVAQRDTPYAALSEAISAAEAKAELVGNIPANARQGRFLSRCASCHF